MAKSKQKKKKGKNNSNNIKNQNQQNKKEINSRISKSKSTQKSKSKQKPARHQHQQQTPQFQKNKKNTKSIQIQLQPYHKNLNNHLDQILKQTLQVYQIQDNNYQIFDKLCNDIIIVLQKVGMVNNHQKLRSLQLMIKIVSLDIYFINKFDAKIVQLMIDFIQNVPEELCSRLLDKLISQQKNIQRSMMFPIEKNKTKVNLNECSKKIKKITILQKIIINPININSLFSKLNQYKENILIWKIIQLFIKQAETGQNYFKHYDFMMRLIVYLDSNILPKFFQKQIISQYFLNVIDMYINQVQIINQENQQLKKECQKKKFPLFKLALSSLIGMQKDVFAQTMARIYQNCESKQNYGFFLLQFIQVFSTQLMTQQDNKIKRHSYLQDKMSKKCYNMTHKFLILIEFNKFIIKIITILEKMHKIKTQRDFYQDNILISLQNCYKLAIFIDIFKASTNLQTLVEKINNLLQNQNKIEIQKTKQISSKQLQNIQAKNNNDIYKVQQCQNIIYRVHFEIKNVLLAANLQDYQDLYIQTPNTFEIDFFRKILNKQPIQTTAHFMSKLINHWINMQIPRCFYLKDYIKVYLFQHCIKNYLNDKGCLIIMFNWLSKESFLKMSTMLFKDTFQDKQMPQTSIPKSLQAQQMQSQLTSGGRANIYYFADKYFQTSESIIQWASILNNNGKRKNQNYYLHKFYFECLYSSFLEITQKKNQITQYFIQKLNQSLKRYDIQGLSINVILIYLINFRFKMNLTLARTLIQFFLKNKETILTLYDKVSIQKKKTFRYLTDTQQQCRIILKNLQIQKKIHNISIRTFLKIFQASGQNIIALLPKSIAFQQLNQDLIQITKKYATDFCILGTIRRLSSKASNKIFNKMLFQNLSKNKKDIPQLLIYRQTIHSLYQDQSDTVRQYNKIQIILKILQLCIQIILINIKQKPLQDKKILKSKIIVLQILKVIRNLSLISTAYQKQLKQKYQQIFQKQLKYCLWRILYKHQQICSKFQIELITHLRIRVLQWVIQDINEDISPFVIMDINQIYYLLTQLIMDQNSQIRIFVFSRVISNLFKFPIKLSLRKQIALLTVIAVKQPIQEIKNCALKIINSVDCNKHQIIALSFLTFLKLFFDTLYKFGTYDDILQQGVKLWCRGKQNQITIFSIITTLIQRKYKFVKKRNIEDRNKQIINNNNGNFNQNINKNINYNEYSLTKSSSLPNYQSYNQFPSQIQINKDYKHKKIIHIGHTQNFYMDQSSIIFQKVKRVICQRQGFNQIKANRSLFIQWSNLEKLGIVSLIHYN